MNAGLKIDPEFESMCPPLTDEEYEQLEENIVAEGEVLMPLIIWDGIIVDGHNRYKIAQAYPKVIYSTRDKEFANRYEAISWICKNQLGRRNLTPRDKEYLIGKRYEAEKMSHGAADGFRGNQYENVVTGKICPLPQEASHLTRERIAQETGTSERYVGYAEQFAKGVDAAESAVPGIKKEILSGAIKPTKPEVIAIAKAPPKERRNMAEELRIPKEIPQLKSMRKQTRRNLKEVRDVCAEMADDSEAPTSEDSILETLHGSVTDMIRICDTLFGDFPCLLTDNTYKAKVIEILQEPKNYIKKIEEGD